MGADGEQLLAQHDGHEQSGLADRSNCVLLPLLETHPMSKEQFDQVIRIAKWILLDDGKK